MINKMIKMFIVTMAMIVCFGLVFATNNFKANNIETSYVDASGEVQTETDVVIIDDANSLCDGGWFIVNEDVTLTSNISARPASTFNIILADGATLKTTGIDWSMNNFVFYGQSEGTGKFIIESTSNEALSFNGGGSLTINSGNVEITTTGNYGMFNSQATVTVNGGSLKVTSSDTAITVNTLDFNDGSLEMISSNRTLQCQTIHYNSNDLYYYGATKEDAVVGCFDSISMNLSNANYTLFGASLECTEFVNNIKTVDLTKNTELCIDDSECVAKAIKSLTKDYSITDYTNVGIINSIDQNGNVIYAYSTNNDCTDYCSDSITLNNLKKAVNNGTFQYRLFFAGTATFESPANKNNTGLVIAIVLLSVAALGATGYILVKKNIIKLPIKK